jgi:photosynthetic reaction center H subunit
VYVHALLAAQFANVPTTKLPDQITLLEEEKITAYFGAGLLYATPDRQEPLL